MRGSAVPSLMRTAVRAGGKRLGAVWFNLLQTSLAAGLSWYLAHDVLDHPQPFFAPIAAAVSLSTSNVLRAQRAVQMMIGVTLGIGLGTVVQGMLGPGALPIAVAALVALGAAVFIGGGFIGHGMMFANQTVVSALLVLALYRGGAGPERIFDALIGGAVAIVVAVLLFPADPRTVLGAARAGVLAVLHDVLSRAADVSSGRRAAPPDWPLSAVDRVHEQLSGLLEARTTARHVVAIAPRRWGLRDAVRAADHQAVHVALLA
ncbi:aromatic acid exporter family protein, partial [Mycobacterium avium]